MSAALMIQVSDLGVAFGEGRRRVSALEGVWFTVPEGQAFGLVGESGAGKSTVLRALAGLLDRWSGRIAIDNVEKNERRNSLLPRTVQMVFQDPYGSLHPRHTVDRILSEPLRVHRRGRTSARVAQALADVGLGPGFRFRFAHQLSGGQRQRVAIARALILEPKVVLLDEPTSALDVSVQAEILNLLARLRRAHGLTYVLVSHDLAVVAHMCDRLGVMQGGRIVEELTPAELASGEAMQPYTRELLAASHGYSRAAGAGKLAREESVRRPPV